MELKRRDRSRVQTEIVEFIALPFPFPSKLKICMAISRRSCAGTATCRVVILLIKPIIAFLGSVDVAVIVS